MALLNLLAKLGLDTSEFNAKLGQAEGRSNLFARKFQGSFAGGIAKFATLGFGIGALRSVLMQARELEDANRGMLTGMALYWESYKEAAVTALANTMIVFSSFVDKMLGLDSDLVGTFQTLGQTEEQQRDQEGRVRQLEQELSLRRRAREIIKEGELKSIQGLEPEERRLAIEEKIAALKRRVEQGAPGGGGPRLGPGKAMDLLGEITDWQLRLDRIREGKQKPEFQTRTFGAGSLDPLAKIGGFTGGADVKIISIQERIARATEKTAENTGEATVELG